MDGWTGEKGDGGVGGGCVQWSWEIIHQIVGLIGSNYGD